MSRWLAAAAVTAGAVALTACGAQDGSAPAGPPVTSGSASSGAPAAPVATQPVAGADPALTAQAALTPCPASDPRVPARADGLPDLTLRCLGNGPAVRLAGLRDQPMVISVWASYCQPCLTELPVLQQVSGDLGPAVRFLGIDLKDLPDDALRTAITTGTHFASVQDPHGEIRAGLRVIAPPTTLFVRADGSIAHREVGAVTDATALRGLIERYLGVSAG